MTNSASSTQLTALPRVLVTGFEPFENDDINASWEVARALDGWRCDVAGQAPVEVRAVQLRCVFGEALRQLDDALALHQPLLVVCLGLAGGRAEITPERIAINVDDARIPDHAGRQPIDQPVLAGAPAAYFSTLPIKGVVRALRDAGIPASVSNSAGTFVCNHVFFGLMHRLAQAPRPVRGGFVHVPLLPAQAARLPGRPSMALPLQVEGLQRLIRTALSLEQDLAEGGGSLH